ncbi:MAG: PilZ domain-containing protein [Myxococcota bacterium]
MAYIPERGKPRASVRFRVDYTGPTFEGHGTVLNISRTGALIEDADRLLMTGSEIKLRFSFFQDSVPIEIPAQVVRETDRGFGVRFTKLTPRTRSVLGMAIAKLRQSLEDAEGAAILSDDDDITLLKT